MKNGEMFEQIGVGHRVVEFVQAIEKHCHWGTKCAPSNC